MCEGSPRCNPQALTEGWSCEMWRVDRKAHMYMLYVSLLYGPTTLLIPAGYQIDLSEHLTQPVPLPRWLALLTLWVLRRCLNALAAHLFTCLPHLNSLIIFTNICKHVRRGGTMLDFHIV
ncbi:MAG: hypothetical protein NXY57DRAFT_28323 [Lentinula lateritia]|nr:MAG: hypothetical protein NXY57DRAFT_28323 [Lentinula lateritia]